MGTDTSLVVDCMRRCQHSILGATLVAAALWLPVTVAYAQWSAELVEVSKVGVRVHLGESSRTEFLNLIHAYAEREHFQIIDGGGYPDFNGQPVVNLSLVRGDGVKVDVVGIDVNTLGFDIAVYAEKENASWSVAAKQLIADLRARWPKAIEVSYPETATEHPAEPASTVKAAIVVHLGESVLTKFKAVMRAYAKHEGFQITNEIDTTDVNGHLALGLKLVREDGVEIDVQGADIDMRGYWITVDAKKQNAAWRSATLRLVKVLQSNWWPNAVTVEYPSGAKKSRH